MANSSDITFKEFYIQIMFWKLKSCPLRPYPKVELILLYFKKILFIHV